MQITYGNIFLNVFGMFFFVGAAILIGAILDRVMKEKGYVTSIQPYYR